MQDANPRPAPDQAAPLTEWLNQAIAGDAAAGERVYQRVYEELRKIARAVLGSNRNDFSPTVLVNESYLRLFPDRLNQLQDRQEFFRIAARSMRQIVIDDLRARGADKRGGDWVRTELDEKIALPEAPDIESLDQALRRLRQKDNELADLVDAYFFAGMTFDALAELENTSVRTIRRRWETARLLLLHELDQ